MWDGPRGKLADDFFGLADNWNQLRDIENGHIVFFWRIIKGDYCKKVVVVLR